MTFIPSGRLPVRLGQLGFQAHTVNGQSVIVPPVCAVPAGKFLMGSDRRQDKELADDEKPRHRIQLAAYQIGRFPVTVAEYACFVRTGHPEPPLEAPAWQIQIERPDNPIVNVSWYDATEYARWLATMTGHPWRLPTEAEWEKAARWDEARRHARNYPWGDDFDTPGIEGTQRCNIFGSVVPESSGAMGLPTMAPVGSYPLGVSPCGAQDMAGNMWEWISTIYKPYPYRATDGRERLDSTERRVLRGGSYDGMRWHARSAKRLHDTPSDYGRVAGFRLALCS